MYVSGTAQRTYFVYSDEGLVAEDDGSGVELRSYGYRPDSTWTTDPLFLKQGNEYYFYQNDHLGTPQKLTGMTGAVVWSAQECTTVRPELVEGHVRGSTRSPRTGAGSARADMAEDDGSGVGLRSYGYTPNST